MKSESPLSCPLGVTCHTPPLYTNNKLTLAEGNPDRIKESHVPGGWIPFGQKTRAIRGHRYGLRLTPSERAQLIAFLRTL